MIWHSTSKTVPMVIILCWTLLHATGSNAQFEFGTPKKLPDTVNGPALDFQPSISSDGLELYFTSNRDAGRSGWGTWVARRDRVEDDFGPPDRPANHSAFNNFNHPSISDDGLTLYGNVAGRFGNEDLHMATRASEDAPWDRQLTNLGGNVNTSQFDHQPDISADGRELYFFRSSGWDSGNGDLFVAMQDDPTDLLGFAPAENLGPEVNDPSAWEMSPNISSNGLWLFFSSNGSGGVGDFDLWVTMRPSLDAPWGEPINLGEAINTFHYEGGPSMSADNKTVYFNRGPSGLQPEDIWQVPILSTPMPEPGDVNWDGVVDVRDIDAISLCVRRGCDDLAFDTNDDGAVNGDDRTF